MSERGGSVPGAPPRIPGIPSNAHFHELAQFRTLNQQRPRPSIEDQEMAWSQNMMPIGEYYLRAIPDRSAQIFGVPAGPPEAVEFVGSQTPTLQLDGTSNGNIIMATSAPFIGTCGPLATTRPDDFVVLITTAEKIVGTGVSPPEITSVVSTSGLNWQRRYRLVGQILSDYYPEFGEGPSLIDVVVEVWWAVAPHALAAETITITYGEAINNRVDSAIFGCFAIAGANVHAGWDGSTMSASSNTYLVSTSLTVDGVTTANSYDFLFNWFANFTNPTLEYGFISGWPELSGGPIHANGWVYAAQVEAGENIGAWNQAIATYLIVTNPLTNFAASIGGNPSVAAAAWVGIADAVQGYTGVPTTLTISHLAGLPATADTILIAGWIGHNRPGTSTILMDTGIGGISLTVDVFGFTSSTWTFEAKQANGTAIVTASATLTADNMSDGWHCFAVSMRASTQTLQILVDQQLLTMSPSWASSLPVGFAPGDGWQVGPFAAVAELSSLWFAAGDPFFDLSTIPNQAILFGGGFFCWKDWGPEGQSINGLQPALFLYGDAASYPQNRGFGGDFMVSGTALETVGGPTACT